MSEGSLIGYILRTYWKTFFCLLWPLVLVPLLILGAPYPEKIHLRCLYIYLFMAGYWLSRCWPPSVTGYLPIVLMPLLTVANSDVICNCYLAETVYVQVASMVYGLSIESSKLHRRLSLRAMNLFQGNIRLVHFSFLSITMFLSFWFPNILVTRMMCSLIGEILQEGAFDLNNKSASDGFFIGTAYAATIGGMATIFGCGSNLLYRAILFDGYTPSRYPNDVNLIGTWIIVSLPITLITFIIMTIWIQYACFGSNNLNNFNTDRFKEIIEEKCNRLESISFQEFFVAILIPAGLITCILRRPEFFGQEFCLNIKDSVPLFIIIMIMSCLPEKLTIFKAFSKNDSERNKTEEPCLVPWNKFEKTILWDHVITLSGGIALSYGINHSKLGVWIGEHLQNSINIERFPLMFLVALITSILTEFTWNVCIVALFLPILTAFSNRKDWNPIVLGKTTTLASSHSFCTFVSTPSNRLIGEKYNVEGKDLFITGLVVKLASMIILLGFFYLIGDPVYKFNQIEHLFYNSTLTSNGEAPEA